MVFLGVAETIAASVLCCGVGIVQCLQRHLLITPIDNALKVLFKPRVCLHGGMGTLGRSGNSLRWGNPLIHIVSLEFDHLYMIGAVKRRMLPHLSGVHFLQVNRPLERILGSTSGKYAINNKNL